MKISSRSRSRSLRDDALAAASMAQYFARMAMPRGLLAFGFVLSISCGGSSGGAGGGVVMGAYGGTWDVSTLGDDPAGAGSQLIVANDTVTGALINEDEGKDIGDDCVHTKDRVTVDLRFEGNAMTGTLTALDSWRGPSSSPNAYCPTGDDARSHTVTGTRTNAGVGADGDWEITVTDESPFIVSISGNSAKAWDKKDKERGKDPKLTAVVVGNSATTASKDDDFGFAAKRR